MSQSSGGPPLGTARIDFVGDNNDFKAKAAEVQLIAEQVAEKVQQTSTDSRATKAAAESTYLEAVGSELRQSIKPTGAEEFAEASRDAFRTTSEEARKARSEIEATAGTFGSLRQSILGPVAAIGALTGAIVGLIQKIPELIEYLTRARTAFKSLHDESQNEIIGSTLEFYGDRSRAAAARTAVDAQVLQTRLKNISEGIKNDLGDDKIDELNAQATKLGEDEKARLDRSYKEADRMRQFDLNLELERKRHQGGEILRLERAQRDAQLQNESEARNREIREQNEAALGNQDYREIDDAVRRTRKIQEAIDKIVDPAVRRRIEVELQASKEAEAIALKNTEDRLAKEGQARQQAYFDELQRLREIGNQQTAILDQFRNAAAGFGTDNTAIIGELRNISDLLSAVAAQRSSPFSGT